MTLRLSVRARTFYPWVRGKPPTGQVSLRDPRQWTGARWVRCAPRGQLAPARWRWGLSEILQHIGPQQKNIVDNSRRRAKNTKSFIMSVRIARQIILSFASRYLVIGNYLGDSPGWAKLRDGLCRGIAQRGTASSDSKDIPCTCEPWRSKDRAKFEIMDHQRKNGLNYGV